MVWAVTGYLWEETSIMRRNLDMATLDEKLCLEYPQAYAADVDCVDKFRKSYDFLVKGTAPITNGAMWAWSRSLSRGLSFMRSSAFGAG